MSPRSSQRDGIEPSQWRLTRWIVLLFGLAAIVLVPWVVLLVRALPSAHRAAHWDIAWGGFDAVLALLLLSVAVATWRRSAWLEGATTALAALLFADAWFDVLTSSTRTELLVALGEAVLVELPLATLSLLLARAAKRELLQPRPVPVIRSEPTEPWPRLVRREASG